MAGPSGSAGRNLALMVPAERARLLAGNDATDITPGVTRGLHMNSADANVALTLAGMEDGAVVTLYLLQGQTYPYQAKRYWATGTDAGVELVGLW